MNRFDDILAAITKHVPKPTPPVPVPKDRDTNNTSSSVKGANSPPVAAAKGANSPQVAAAKGANSRPVAAAKPEDKKVDPKKGTPLKATGQVKPSASVSTLPLWSDGGGHFVLKIRWKLCEYL